jgi:hypothetical protein
MLPLLYYYHKGNSAMGYDPILRWKKSASPDVVKYVVSWTFNGSLTVTKDVAVTGTGNLAGYSARFGDHNPTQTLTDGDVVGATVKAVDVVGLESAVVTATDVTVPAEPPTVPVDVVLSLS